jgi:hypothetical protein
MTPSQKTGPTHHRLTRVDGGRLCCWGFDDATRPFRLSARAGAFSADEREAVYRAIETGATCARNSCLTSAGRRRQAGCWKPLTTRRPSGSCSRGISFWCATQVKSQVWEAFSRANPRRPRCFPANAAGLPIAEAGRASAARRSASASPAIRIAAATWCWGGRTIRGWIPTRPSVRCRISGWQRGPKGSASAGSASSTKPT